MRVAAIGLIALLASTSGCAWIHRIFSLEYAPRRRAIIPDPTPTGVRAYTSTPDDPTPRERFQLDEQRVVLQLVERQHIPSQAECELRVRPEGASELSYVARWVHRREMDQTSIVCEARRFHDWRRTPGDYVLEIAVRGVVRDRHRFSLVTPPEPRPEFDADPHARGGREQAPQATARPAGDERTGQKPTSARRVGAQSLR